MDARVEPPEVKFDYYAVQLIVPAHSRDEALRVAGYVCSAVSWMEYIGIRPHVEPTPYLGPWPVKTP